MTSTWYGRITAIDRSRNDSGPVTSTRSKMPRHARQASRDEALSLLSNFLTGGSKVTLQFVRVEGESLKIEATSAVLYSVLAWVPGLPRSVRVLIMRRRQTFENRGRPGTEANSVPCAWRAHGLLDIDSKFSLGLLRAAPCALCVKFKNFQLAEIATSQPHAAYAAFVHGLSSRWTYLSRTIPEVSDLFQPLEDAMLKTNQGPARPPSKARWLGADQSHSNL